MKITELTIELQPSCVMRKMILLAVTALAAVSFGTSAGDSVARNQIVTTTYTLHVNNQPAADHFYTVVLNPCDGTIAISGYYGDNQTETVTGSLANGVITFQSSYNFLIYEWGGSFPVAGGPALSFFGPGVTSLTVDVTGTSSTDYKNHGEYVAAMGGGSDAAHSCIGLPVQARPNK